MRTLPFLLLLSALTFGGVDDARALIIGMSPDPLTTPLVTGTQTEVEFLGATVGALPVGGILLDGAIGGTDDVLQLRFTNVGSTVLNLVAIAPFPFEDFDLTAAGWLPGGAVPPQGQVSGADFASVALAGMAPGGFVDVFFAFTSIADGAGASLGGYGPILVSQAEVTFAVPEPALLLLVASGGAALRGRRRD